MLIRRANSSDSQVLSELVLASSLSVRASDFTDEGWRLLEKTNTVEAFKARFESANYFALICEVDAIAAGYFGVIDNEKIDHMFVLSEYRNKGIASSLWAEVQTICSKSGKGHYYWVRSSSYAEPVYESFGFRAVAERQQANGISFRLMEKHCP